MNHRQSHQQVVRSAILATARFFDVTCFSVHLYTRTDKRARTLKNTVACMQ